MTGATARHIPFVALNDVMQPDYRAVVVRRALTFRRQAAPASRQRLDAALAEHVKLRELDEQTAIAPTTLNMLTEACQRDNVLMLATLGMWQQSQLPLARRMREFLRSKGLTTIELENLTDGFLGTSPQEEMLALVNEFHTRNPSFNVYDAALMLCCVHGRLPSAAPVAQAAPAEELHDMLAELDQLAPGERTRWHALLDDIRRLPLEAAEWDEQAIRSFTAAVQRVAEQRLHERQAIRGRLQQALALLREQALAELEYFGFADACGWSDASFSLAEVAPLAEQVTNFYTKLLAHRSGLQQAPASTRALQIERRRQLDELEEQILAEYTRLATRFSAPSSVAEPAADAAPPAPPAQPEPATSEAPIHVTDVILAKSDEPLFAQAEPSGDLAIAVGGTRRSFFRRR